MRAIRKRPGQEPQVIDVENSLEALQREVDGWIETVTFAEDACLICNEEGRIQGLLFNLGLFGILFFGTVLVVGTAGEDFTDLSDVGVERMMQECSMERGNT